MSKEELEKYAEEYAKNLAFVFETDIVQRIVRERVRLALIDILESREKPSSELEQELNYQKQARSIAENAVVDLTKENKNLKGRIVAGDVLEDEMAKKIKELEEQIKKMKYTLNKIIETVHNDRIHEYDTRLVVIHDFAYACLEEIKEK